MFDPLKQEHDMCIHNLFKEYEICDKKKITSAFLFSLGRNLLNYRAALSVYAIMQSFPYHNFECFEENENYCKYCGSTASENVDLTFFDQCRFAVGGIVSLNVYEYLFYLKQANLMEEVYPSKEDFEIFINILDVLKYSNVKDTPNVLTKKLRFVNGFKSNEEQRKALIETLGYCSILETQAHKGFLSKFTILELAPQKRHSSDWRYPVDWWEGKDGINKDALMFWFSPYPEICSYVKML